MSTTWTFRPRLEAMDDRIVPDGAPPSNPGAPPPGPVKPPPVAAGDTKLTINFAPLATGSDFSFDVVVTDKAGVTATVPVKVVGNDVDPESIRDRVFDALKDAGWKVQKPVGSATRLIVISNGDPALIGSQPAAKIDIKNEKNLKEGQQPKRGSETVGSATSSDFRLKFSANAQCAVLPDDVRIEVTVNGTTYSQVFATGSTPLQITQGLSALLNSNGYVTSLDGDALIISGLNVQSVELGFSQEGTATVHDWLDAEVGVVIPS